jgi:hypothetical protein
VSSRPAWTAHKKSLVKNKINGNIKKGIYEKPTSNILFHAKRPNAFSLVTGTRQPALITSIQLHTEEAFHCNEAEQKFQIGKKKVKLFLFTDDILIYLENLKTSFKNCLDLIIPFNKVSEY